MDTATTTDVSAEIRKLSSTDALKLVPMLQTLLMQFIDAHVEITLSVDAD